MTNTKNPLILVIERNQTVRDDLAFSLATKFAARAEGVGSVREAVDWIKEKNELLHLIVVEDSSELPNLLKYLAKNRMHTPCLLLTDDPNRDVEAYLSPNLRLTVDRGRIIEDLYKKATGALSGQSFELQDDYCPIPTHLLERVSPIRGDVYIRLSAQKYLRLFAQNDFCSQADIEKYAIRKGVKYLYLRKHDMANFMRSINDHLLRVLEQMRARNMTSEESDRIASETIDSVQAYVLRFGFTEAAREVAERAIEITEQTVLENPKLSQIFHRFAADTTRYTPVHSLVIAHVASAICSELQWNAKGTLYKLILAAILHDIAIPNEQLATIATLKELEDRSGEFTDKEKEIYRTHPMLAMQVAEKFRQVPPDVAQIIHQHHERPDGSGFPRGISANHITPLSAVFIVSHELVRRLLLNRQKFRLEDEFLSLVKIFDHGATFHSILGVLDPFNQKQKLKLYG